MFDEGEECSVKGNMCNADEKKCSSKKKHVGLEKFGKSGSMIRMAGRYDCLLAVLLDVLAVIA
jgi:hypothetical protein